jgi:hypothetical protein
MSKRPAWEQPNKIVSQKKETEQKRRKVIIYLLYAKLVLKNKRIENMTSAFKKYR